MDKQVQFQNTDTAIVANVFYVLSLKVAKLHLNYLEFTLLELKMLHILRLSRLDTP